MHIGEIIVAWYEQCGRDMAWRETRDPYRIWIAEVILQQTRIAQGEQYFYRFVERFPDVASLAAATQEEVLKYWEGLGYYSRARNLHAAARHIIDALGGHMPGHYSEWMQLKGIGPYTARAIGSFAYGDATGVIDGNVMRVMSRFLGDSSPVDAGTTRKKFQETIDAWVQGVDSRAFNHGIMDLGSVVCMPTQPACPLCPLVEGCAARREGAIHLLPHKQKRNTRKVRYFDFFLVRNAAGEIAVRKRPEKGIWGGLWEIPNLEMPIEVWQQQRPAWKAGYRGEMKHVFTHFDMQIHIYAASDVDVPGNLADQFISTDKISIFAFSKAVLKIFEKWLNTD